MNRVQKRRLQPTLLHYDYLVLTRIRTAIKSVIHTELQGRTSRILDVGCGGKVYEPLSRGLVKQFVGIDIFANSNADTIAVGEHLPFCNGSFDVVLYTQVLEHVPNPVGLIQEIDRVLRPGSITIVSTHGMHPVHGAPFDFWRWTNHGLERLFASSSSCCVYPNGGNMLCLFQLANIFIWERLVRLWSPLRFLGAPFFLLTNLIELSLEKLGLFSG